MDMGRRGVCRRRHRHSVNVVLLPADPELLLRREAAERLRAVARAITAAR